MLNRFQLLKKNFDTLFFESSSHAINQYTGLAAERIIEEQDLGGYFRAVCYQIIDLDHDGNTIAYLNKKSP